MCVLLYLDGFVFLYYGDLSLGLCFFSFFLCVLMCVVVLVSGVLVEWNKLKLKLFKRLCISGIQILWSIIWKEYILENRMCVIFRWVGCVCCFIKLFLLSGSVLFLFFRLVLMGLLLFLLLAYCRLVLLFLKLCVFPWSILADTLTQLKFRPFSICSLVSSFLCLLFFVAIMS